LHLVLPSSIARHACQAPSQRREGAEAMHHLRSGSKKRIALITCLLGLLPTVRFLDHSVLSYVCDFHFATGDFLVLPPLSDFSECFLSFLRPSKPPASGCGAWSTSTTSSALCTSASGSEELLSDVCGVASDDFARSCSMIGRFERSKRTH
jgi:hypothetical protein